MKRTLLYLPFLLLLWQQKKVHIALSKKSCEGGLEAALPVGGYFPYIDRDL